MWDALVDLLAALLQPLVDALPDGAPLPIPDLTGVGQLVGALDSLVPIAELLAVVVGLLAVGAAFVALRLVLTVWNLIYP